MDLALSGADCQRTFTPVVRFLPRPIAFWALAYAFAAVMLGTTLPTPLYPAYEQRFGFAQLTVTVVYAVYAVGVLIALILLGRASDVVGRKRILLPGVAVAALSSVIFLVAGGSHTGGETLLFVGRVLSGLSAGIFTGTATATLADLGGEGNGLRATLVAAVANIGGLGLGPLTGGLLAKYVDWPLRTPYLLHLGLLALAAAAVLAIPETVHVDGPRRFRIARLQVPPQVRATFIRAATAGFAGFAVLGLFTAVTPSFLGVLGHHNPALTGLVVFSIFAASAAGQLISAASSTRTALLAGTALLVVGLVVVAFSLGQASLGLLVTGAVIAGSGQGMSFRAALGSVTAATPVEQRGGVSSSFFATCYVGISLPVVGVGLASKSYGLVHTGEVFAGIVAALAFAAFTSLLVARAP
jgi:MFS family permease